MWIMWTEWFSSALIAMAVGQDLFVYKPQVGILAGKCCKKCECKTNFNRNAICKWWVFMVKLVPWCPLVEVYQGSCHPAIPAAHRPCWLCAILMALAHSCFLSGEKNGSKYQSS
jgi:hypothetical protein